MAQTLREAGGRRPASWRRWALHAIGPAVLVAILATLDRDALGAALRAAEPAPLVAAYLVPLPAILLRVARWRLLLGGRGGRWSFGELTAIYAGSIAAGVVTPGRLGELAKAGVVAGRGTGLGPALWSSLLDRLLDLAFLALLAAAALPLVVGGGGGGGGSTWIAAWGIAGAGVGATLLAYLAGAPGSARWRRRLLAWARVNAAEDAAADASPEPPLVPKRAAAACVALTAASWAVTYLASFLYARSLGLPIGYLEIAAVSAVCSLVASLPVSIAGAGTRDAALLVLLAPWGVTPAESVALSTLMLSNVLFVGAVCTLAFLHRGQ